MIESSCFSGGRLAPTPGPWTRLAACLGLLALLAVPTNAEPQQTELELWDGRFVVHATYPRSAQGSDLARAYVSSAGRQSAVLHFFHPTNPELLVKILDGRSINGHFWIFYGAITTLPVDLHIEDRVTGATRVYRKPGGAPRGDSDVEAFADSSFSSAGAAAVSTVVSKDVSKAESKAESKASTFGTCVSDPFTLCFQDGRFRVASRWSLGSPDGQDSAARVARGSDRSGYLWFFDADTPEILVKILDGRPINDSYWVLFGSATHLPFRLVVTDLQTGIEKEFSADAFGGGSDTSTFGPGGDLPDPPQILAPADGAIVNPHDPPLAIDLEDIDLASSCLDYRIVEETPNGELLAWSADCLAGEEGGRLHLGLGRFAGDHVVTATLAGDAPHRLLVRRRVAGLAGPWAERNFQTGELEGAVYPLFGEGAVSFPAPTWTVGGEPVHLPDISCSLRLESGTTPILSFRSTSDGAAAECRIETPHADPSPVRVVIQNCAHRLQLGPSEIHWRTRTPDGRARSVSLPAVDILLGKNARFDVASGGSTFFADPTAAEVPELLDPVRLARHSASPWWLAPGLEIERVETAGLALPVNLTPGPGLSVAPAEASPDDPLFYVTELYGAIRVVRRDGSFGTYADGLLNFDPTGDFPGSGELGLVGTVVDPANGDLLASLVYRTDSPDPLFEFSGKVIRLSSDDGGRTAARVETVLDLGPETKQSKSHQISHLSFGSDGMLYVHVGDGFAFQQSQILDNFAGKILRLRPDGSAPPDNPYYDADDGLSAADYVFALGLRNPFGGAWGPDGRLYEVENGPAVDRIARVEPGFNYAWGTNDEGTDEQMRVGALFNWPNAVTPIDLVFVPEASPSLPEGWWGRALVSEFGPTYRFGSTPRGKRLALFDLFGQDSEAIAPRTVLRYDGLGPATVAATALVTGTPEHDGFYFVDFFPEPFDDADAEPTTAGARLWRIRAAD